MKTTNNEAQAEKSASLDAGFQVDWPVDKEVLRALEMMKRVKTFNTTQTGTAPEDERMPSLFTPQPLFLCLG